MSDAKQTVLITGANPGLGLEVANALARTDQSFEIIIGSRKLANGETAVSTIKANVPNIAYTFSVVEIDLESDTSITAACDNITSRFDGLDVLVNNAGAAFDRQAREENVPLRDTWARSWDVNVVGTTNAHGTASSAITKVGKPETLIHHERKVVYGRDGHPERLQSRARWLDQGET